MEAKNISLLKPQKYTNSKQHFKRFIKGFKRFIKSRLNGHVCNFSLNYNSLDISGIVNIETYLMEKCDTK